MKKHSVFLVVGAVLAAAVVVAGPPKPPGDTPVSAAALEQARAAARQTVGAGWDRYVSSQGCAAAEAHPLTKEFWATAVRVPGQQDAAQAGFRVRPWVVPTKLVDAKVRAKFVLPVAQGHLSLRLKVDCDGAMVGFRENLAVAPQAEVQLVTDKFTVEKDKRCVVYAFLWLTPRPEPRSAAHAAGSIPEIAWDF